MWPFLAMAGLQLAGNYQGSQQAAEQLRSGTRLQQQTAAQQKALTQPFYTALQDLMPTFEARSLDYTMPMEDTYYINRGARDLSRRLRAVGRENSTYGMGKMGEYAAGIGKSYEDDYYNRLLNLTRLGQGQAGSASNLMGQGAGNLSNIIANRAQLGMQYNPMRVAADLGTGLYRAYQGYNAMNPSGGMTPEMTAWDLK